MIKYNEPFRYVHSTRANCHISFNMNVPSWKHDPVAIGYTFTRDDINYCKHISCAYIMAKCFFFPPKDELSSRNTQLCTHCNCDM